MARKTLAKTRSLKQKRVGDFACPVETAVAVIGGKWKAPILHHLEHADTLRFSQLRRLLPGATQQMIVTQLRELERDGILRRVMYREMPPRVEYSLTELGRTLSPVLDAMCAWGQVFEARLCREATSEAVARPAAAS